MFLFRIVDTGEEIIKQKFLRVYRAKVEERKKLYVGVV